MILRRSKSFLVLSFFVLSLTAFGQKDKQLFSFISDATDKVLAQPSSPASVREAFISFEDQAFRSGVTDSIHIPLFDGKSYQANAINIERRSMDNYSWHGKIYEKGFEGDVSLTFYKGFVSGLIYSPEAVFEILPRGDKQILMQLDQDLFPPCGGAVEGDKPQLMEANKIAASGVAQDSGDRIDVVIVYTTATKNLLGGDTQARTFAQQAVDSANAAYLNSKIRQRLRLVHSQELAYTESGSHQTDLSAFRNNTAMHALRNTHNADMMAQLSEITTACGVAYFMGALPGNANNAYSVTARSCAIGNVTFAHELGHNMGSDHNVQNTAGPTFPYSHGHFVNGNYRTVMSYTDWCVGGCARRPIFSNPSIVYQGSPAGVIADRDNARSINNTADYIANYRYSGKSITMTNFNGQNMVPRMLNNTVTWTSNNVTGNLKIELSRNETTSWETLVTNVPNTGSAKINIYGAATKNARLRISSLNDPTVSDTSVNNLFIR